MFNKKKALFPFPPHPEGWGFHGKDYMKKNNILNSAHFYTEEEVKSIKNNLNIAFGIDYIPVETTLQALVKDNKKLNNFDFIKGETFAFYNPIEIDKMGIKQGWHLLKITYQRLDIVFFKIITSSKPRTEQYAFKDSQFVSKLNPLVINIERFGIPEKNLSLIGFEKSKGIPYDITIVTSSTSYTI